MPETNEIRRTHFWTFASLKELSTVEIPLYCYRGIVSGSAFMDTNPGKTKKNILTSSLPSFLHLELYSKLCTIELDLSHLATIDTSSVLPLVGGLGKYYRLNVDLVMFFGGTEIEVQACWQENVRSKFLPKLNI